MSSLRPLEHDESTDEVTLPTDPGAPSRRTVELDVPYVVVLAGRDVGRVYKLREPELIIGRGTGAHIMVDDGGVSRHHAKLIRASESEVRVVDLDSRNGTWVEGERIDERVLKEGDRIQVGADTTLKLGYRDTLEESLFSQLYASATRDPLTALYNRRALYEQLEREIAWHKRHRQPLSLILADIDEFKQVNDEHGHLAGDAVLITLGKICTDQCRSEDLLARLGGDELVCVLRQTATLDAQLVAERLRAEVSRTTFRSRPDGAGDPIRVTVSIGVVTASGGELDDATRLLEAADRNMYTSKRSGRNRVSAFGPTG